MSSDLAGLRDQRVEQLYRWDLPGRNKHSTSGDIMVLVCHVISYDHLIKASSDFMSRTCSS